MREWVAVGLGRKCVNKTGSDGGAVPDPEVCRAEENQQPPLECTQEKPRP